MQQSALLFMFFKGFQAKYKRDHLHASENILIAFSIAVTSWLDALDSHKNVLQRIQWSTMIKWLSQVGNLCEDSKIRHRLVFVWNESAVLAERYDGINIKNASLHY